VTKLSQGERIVLVGGLLLILDLLFVQWHSVDVSRLDLDFQPARTGATGVQEPYAAYGVVAVILTAVMVAQIVIARLTPVRLPGSRMFWAQAHLIAGVFVAVVLVIKLLRATKWLGFGSYSGVLAGLLVAYGGYCIARESSGPA
jgi:ascorbate-specific PTS system EIIC-type component UlaA